MTKKPDLDPEDIIVDTREQKPLWRCPPATRAKLSTGDYSLKGYEGLIAVERKSVADAYGSTGRGRDRFQRSIGRLSRMAFGAVIVEGTIKDVRAYQAIAKRKNPRAKMTASAVLGSLLTWCDVARRVPLRFVTSRAEARSVIKTWFRKAKERVDKGESWKYNGDVCPCGGGAGVPHDRRCKR